MVATSWHVCLNYLDTVGLFQECRTRCHFQMFDRVFHRLCPSVRPGRRLGPGRRFTSATVGESVRPGRFTGCLQGWVWTKFNDYGRWTHGTCMNMWGFVLNTLHEAVIQEDTQCRLVITFCGRRKNVQGQAQSRRILIYYTICSRRRPLSYHAFLISFPITLNRFTRSHCPDLLQLVLVRSSNFHPLSSPHNSLSLPWMRRIVILAKAQRHLQSTSTQT